MGLLDGLKGDAVLAGAMCVLELCMHGQFHAELYPERLKQPRFMAQLEVGVGAMVPGAEPAVYVQSPLAPVTQEAAPPFDPCTTTHSAGGHRPEPLAGSLKGDAVLTGLRRLLDVARGNGEHAQQHVDAAVLEARMRISQFTDPTAATTTATAATTCAAAAGVCCFSCCLCASHHDVCARAGAHTGGAVC